MPVVVVNAESVAKGLSGLMPNVQKKIIRTALRASMKPTRTAIIANTPRGKTGALKKAVVIRAGKRSKYRISFTAGYSNWALGKESNLTGLPLWLEDGTKPRMTKAGRKTGSIKAVKMVARAFASTQKTSADIALSMIVQGIQTEARRIK